MKTLVAIKALIGLLHLPITLRMVPLRKTDNAEEV